MATTSSPQRTPFATSAARSFTRAPFAGLAAYPTLRDALARAEQSGLLEAERRRLVSGRTRFQ